MILIIDSGSQLTHNTARRIRECGVSVGVIGWDTPIEKIAAMNPEGIIHDGSFNSVNQDNSPIPDKRIYSLGIPVLGKCFGLHSVVKHLGGRVVSQKKREYGQTVIERTAYSPLLRGIKTAGSGKYEVLMSHGDSVYPDGVPAGFEVFAMSGNLVAGIQDRKRKLYFLQFHPEADLTVDGRKILSNFALNICSATRDYVPPAPDDIKKTVKDQVGDAGVVAGVSGGKDSSTLAFLLYQAIGNKARNIFVDNGLLRKNEADEVIVSFRQAGIPLNYVDASELFLRRLIGVCNAKRKREIIGRTFISVFMQEAKKFQDVRYLAQGTLYPDVIESQPVYAKTSQINVHHNVGGLPKRLGLGLVEPFRYMFKDEVVRIGRSVGVPEVILGRHPSPGPSLAIRIVGQSVTQARLDLVREADYIFIQELREAGYYDRVDQAFAGLLPAHTYGVMGDEHTLEYMVVLRAVNSFDFITARPSQLPHSLLNRVANRIVSEVKGVNRVVYDETTKPPARIEWE